MDYLNDGDITAGNDLGIQGIWLSPIFSSPTYHKYDAKDYYQVDWRFGNEETLKELIDLCHERNVKIILDLVLNHTSSQHEWFVQFKESRMKGDTSNKYYDYYTCVTAAEKVSGRTYQKIAGVDAFYEVNFSGDMPELDYDNPEVREEMLNVAKYYLDLGVDGFRFDAVKYIYYGDTKKSVDFWKWYMGELEAYCPEIYCVGECWSAESEILQYYGAMNCFNFATSGAESQIARAAKGGSISSYLGYIESFQDKVQKANSNGIPMPFLSNHDMDRIAGAFAIEKYMRMAANLYLLSPGSPFIYYGEEIGIRGSRGGAMTDADRRLAMLWGDSDLIKDPVGATYTNQIDSTVASQLEDENSLLRAYQEIIAVRNRYPAIARGDYNAVMSSNRNFGGFYVEYKGEIVGIFHNTSNSSITIDISTCTGLDGHSFSQLCEVLGGDATLEGSTLTISPQTSVILK
jgi:glycosidase